MHLASCNLFQGISDLQLTRLLGIAVEVRMAKDQWLFQEGQEANHFFVLENGSVELITLVNDKFELPVALLKTPGSGFGMAALIHAADYNVSARCAENGVLFRIDRSKLEKLIGEDHELGCRLMANLARHLFIRLRDARRELKAHFKSLFLLTH